MLVTDFQLHGTIKCFEAVVKLGDNIQSSYITMPWMYRRNKIYNRLGQARDCEPEIVLLRSKGILNAKAQTVHMLVGKAVTK